MMKKRTYNHIMLMAVMLLGVVFASCEHKPLYTIDKATQHVKVVFDWKNLVKGDSVPDGMTLVFYDNENDNYLKYSVDPKEVFEADIPVSDYTIISYDNTHPTIDAVLSREADSLMIFNNDSYTELPVIYASSQTEKIGILTEDENDAQNVTVFPSRLTRTYTIKATGLTQSQMGDGLEGSLSGLAESVFIKDRSLPSDVWKETRSVYLKTQDGVCQGSILTFGVTSGKEDTNILTVIVADSQGVMQRYQFDVREQILSAEDPYNVLITVDFSNAQPVVPVAPEDGDATLLPKVDEYENVDKPIDL